MPEPANAAHQILTTATFRKQFLADIDQAQDAIALQFMTFEGDAAGWAVAERVMRQARRGVDVRMIIDHFSTFYLSDRLALFPSRWREFVATQKMFRALRRAGVKLRRSGPALRPTLRSLLQRNHKKLAVIDDTGYLGGINISDHNLAWRDFMVRCQGPLAGDLLADFDATWRGEIRAPQGDLLHSSQLSRRLPALIGEAREEIIISSPYLWDIPTVRLLSTAARAGRKVTVLTAAQSNFIFFRLGFAHLLHELQQSGADVFFYDRFSHAKYLIIDRAQVLFGSSNFGYANHKILEELCIQSRDSALVAAFISDLFLPEMAQVLPAPPRSRSRRLGMLMSNLQYGFLRFYSREFPPYAPPSKSVQRRPSCLPGRSPSTGD